MARIEVGPQTLHFEDTGGSGPAVLFCHSFTMNGAMFSPQLTAFAGRYRCITWDQRGHGQSPASGPFTLWDSARDAIALLDRLEIDRAILVGTSQGGFVSLRAALIVPDRAAAIKQGLDDAGIKAHIQKTIDGVNANLGNWETIKYFSLLPEDFTEQSGELSLKMDVKRKVVEQHYHDQIESMYTGKSKPS